MSELLPASAAAHGYVRCDVCSRLTDQHEQRCSLCLARLHVRKPFSVQRTSALLLTAWMLYLPANVLPMMVTVEFGRASASTILGGVAALWHHGSYPTAMVIFIASIVVPVAKMSALAWLCWDAVRGSEVPLRRKMWVYRITEVIGRWSMVDVFVVALLVALVQFSGVLRVEPGAAALAYAGMVITTMLAADAFDSRLLWDRARMTAGSPDAH